MSVVKVDIQIVREGRLRTRVLTLPPVYLQGDAPEVEADVREGMTPMLRRHERLVVNAQEVEL